MSVCDPVRTSFGKFPCLMQSLYLLVSNDQVAESWSELLAERCTASFLHGAIILRLVIFALGVARFSSNLPACRTKCDFDHLRGRGVHRIGSTLAVMSLTE